MEWIDILLVVGIFLIVGGAVGYIIYAKKKGQKCIGCPAASSCGGKCASCSGCEERKKNEGKEKE